MRTAPAAQTAPILQTGTGPIHLSIVPDQAPPEQPKTAENSAFQVQPASSITDKLSWSESRIHKVLYNNRIEEWMNYDPDFYNWIRACVMMHADNGCDETRCTIPDRWRDHVGRMVTIVTTDCLPGKKKEDIHQVKAGVYRVMA